MKTGNFIKTTKIIFALVSVELIALLYLVTCTLIKFNTLTYIAVILLFFFIIMEMLWFFILHNRKREKELRAFLSNYDKLKAELKKSCNNEKMLADLCNYYQSRLNKTLDACLEACSDDINDSE